jgi:hypothetical protein
MSAAPTPTPPAAAGQPAALTLDAAEERHQLAVRVLADALLLGVVGDALLRIPSWGANFAVWSIAIIVALLTLARRRYDALPADSRWLLVPAVALSAMFAWRDSASLAAYNALALAATFALLAMALGAGAHRNVLSSRVRDIVQGAVTTGFGAAFGMFPLLLSDVSFHHVARTRSASFLIAGVRAALIAIPLLLVFGGLFAAADPVFARLAGDVLRVDPEEIVSHLVLTGVIAFLVGGVLRTTLLSTRQSTWSLPVPDGALGLTEVSVTLGSLVLLFASFVAVQLRYFFGGDALVQVTAGMSYADYARRGFFELVMVSALVLPVLLAANALLRRATPRADRVYRVLAFTLIGLLAVIMYSAVARMRLYQSVYGLSVDRLYATVFMGWLALVFAWFAVTVLRGRGSRFVAGVLFSGWGTLVALNIADPAGLVARANVARAERGKELDVSYIQSLGADAAPALSAYLVAQPLTAPPEWAVPKTDSAGASVRPDSASAAGQRQWPRDGFTARCYAARQLLERWGPSAARDWRSWTVGRAIARRAVAAREPALRTLASLAPQAAPSVPCPAPPNSVAPNSH